MWADHHRGTLPRRNPPRGDARGARAMLSSLNAALAGQTRGPPQTLGSTTTFAQSDTGPWRKIALTEPNRVLTERQVPLLRQLAMGRQSIPLRIDAQTSMENTKLICKQYCSALFQDCINHATGKPQRRRRASSS